MTPSLPSPASCPDRLRLQRWSDGDDGLADAEGLAAHVATCARCREVAASIQEERALIDGVFAEEERAAADDSRRAFEVVQHRLAATRASAPMPTAAALTPPCSPGAGRRRRWLGAGRSWQLATAALVVACVALTAVVSDQQPVQASADWLISESDVRGRAWRTQPGKIRQEVYDLHTQEAGKPAVHQRQVTVFSTIPGAENTTTQVTDATGALVNATWRRTDGWGARFDTRNGPHLVLDPPTADIDALLATLTGEDADALRYWNSLRLWQVRPQQQAATQAAILSGKATYFMHGIGTLQGEPSFRSDASGYRIAFTVRPRRAMPDGALLSIEDTFASGSLVHERRVIKRVTPAGVLLGESGRTLISRGDADRATLDRLMAQMIDPPAAWRVTRTTTEEALAEARRFWTRMKPLLPPEARPAGPSAPESTTR
ncbi:hypothetical protein [Luteitalea sp.]|jgi:hypothetical protein|uniref:hypothetical protein n=1 Tax=Luteitalea sp. TaxID=2004800 RepID=UPI0037C80F3C